MKKIFNILAVAVLVLLMGSCDRKAEFVHETFASFYASSYTVSELDGEFVVPVVLYNPTGSDIQVSVSAVDGTAVAGEDFEIVSPANGLLNFTAGTDSLAVKVAVTSHEGVITGAKSFTLKLASATEGVSVGNVNTVPVKIQDVDHPLAKFFGVWKATTFEEAYMGMNVTLTLDIAADEKDDTKVVITTVDQMLANVVGITTPVVLEASATYNTEDGTGHIIIPKGQAVGFNYGYGEWVYMGLDAASFGEASSYIDIEMFLNADGTISVPNAFGIFDDKYIWASYVGGYTLTK